MIKAHIKQAPELFNQLAQELELTADQTQELLTDMDSLLAKAFRNWEKMDRPEGAFILVTNQRLMGRYFHSKMHLDIRDDSLVLSEFTELDLDNYLDAVNQANNDPAGFNLLN
jgi:hypothetical protein